MPSDPVRESGRAAVTARVVFGGLAVLAFGLGVAGFRTYLVSRPQYGHAPLDLVYYSLQLFVLDSAPLQNAPRLPVTLEVARLLAPAVTVYLFFLAAQNWLRRRYDRLSVRLAHGHSVVCAPPDIAQRLVTQLRAQIPAPTVVAVGAEPDALPGVLVVPGDPRRSRTLRRAGAHRAREVIVAGPDTAYNAEVAIAVHTAGRGAGRPPTCYAESGDRAVFHAVAEWLLRRAEADRIGTFDRATRTAVALVAQFPPGGERDAPPVVLVLGYRELGRAVVDRLAAEASPGRLRVHVLTGDVPAGAVERRHRGQYAAGSLTARDFDPRTLVSIEDLLVPRDGGDPVAPTDIYVCLEGDTEAITAGNTALELLTEHSTSIVVAVPNSPVIGAGHTGSAEADPVVRRLGSARLAFVNVLEAAYSLVAMRAGTNEQLARNIHERYLQHLHERNEPLDADGSGVPWDELPEYLKASNREQAWDIGRKLGLLNISVVADGRPGQGVTLTDEEITLLAQEEHRRWVKERRTAGWRHGPALDRSARTSPDLVEWGYLSEASRAKDLSAMRSIPDLLASAGLRLVRNR